MVWCSGWRLASAVSNAGGLGLLWRRVYASGVSSRAHPEMSVRLPTVPLESIFPLMYPQIEEIMAIVAEEGVKIVFTSAGNP